MTKIIKKIATAVLACAIMVTGLAACSPATTESSSSSSEIVSSSSSEVSVSEVSSEVSSEASTTDAANDISTAAATAKYVFLFIGDGMSYPQIQATADYLGVEENGYADILDGPTALSFMSFPAAGSATTYDSSSFAPDSASTATSIATGYKTYSGMINVSEDASVTYETIAEQLKGQLGYKIGIVSSVNLNHATPAAFYAHNESRNNYYDIALEMIDSEFDYFAGGALKSPTGAEKDQEDIYTVAETAGYKVIKTDAEAEALTAEDGKAIIIAETLADGDAMSYDNDRVSELSLKDYVEKGIEVLDGDEGFFMMVEGGKIDWAGHANDAASVIADTLALNDAIESAIDFYNQHPDETLIIVTGDHETGGLSIGFAGTNYDTYLDNLQSQTISYAKYDSDYVAAYKENETDFETAMADVKTLFGLMLNTDADATEDNTLVLTDYETEKLKTAFEKTMSTEETELTEAEYVLYGTYEPFTVTVTHILNNKSGIAFTSYAHTGIPVPVFAQGVGADDFNGYYDNTDLYSKMANILGV